MATSPDGNGVILVGGEDEHGYLDSILELRADGQGWVGSWTTLTTKLQYERATHVVIPVVMEKNICDLSGIVPPSTTTMDPLATTTTTTTTTSTTTTSTTTTKINLADHGK